MNPDDAGHRWRTCCFLRSKQYRTGHICYGVTEVTCQACVNALAADSFGPQSLFTWPEPDSLASAMAEIDSAVQPGPLDEAAAQAEVGRLEDIRRRMGGKIGYQAKDLERLGDRLTAAEELAATLTAERDQAIREREEFGYLLAAVLWKHGQDEDVFSPAGSRSVYISELESFAVRKLLRKLDRRRQGLGEVLTVIFES